MFQIVRYIKITRIFKSLLVALVEEDIDNVVEEVWILWRIEASLNLVQGQLELWQLFVELAWIVAFTSALLDLIDGHAEDENVVISDLLGHFDVGAVQSTNRQSTVQLKKSDEFRQDWTDPVEILTLRP